MDGPLAHATVSFGAWPSEPPLDRMNLPPGPAPNIHQMIPYVAPVPGAPSSTFPRIIDDPVNRVYRGPFSFTIAQDRVEAVHFPNRGVYLVICAFVPHFDDEMWGYVRVVR
jgi:hypothetical protein